MGNAYHRLTFLKSTYDKKKHMEEKYKTRKWFITLWNEITDNKSKEIIKNDLLEYVKELENKYTLSYIIHNKEENEKEHIHIYINNRTPIRFETLQAFNKYAHIELIKGNDKQIYNYLLHKDIKSIELGKPKYKEEEIKGNYEFIKEQKQEIGENLLKDIESGMDLWTVIKNNPTLWLHIDKIKQLYEIYQMKLKGNYLLTELIEDEGILMTRNESNNNINYPSNCNGNNKKEI